MKKKLALLLAGVMCVTCLFTGCNNADPNGTGSETGATESGTDTETEKVDITELYNKGKYEGADMSEYLTLGDYAGIITLKESDYVVTQEEIQEEIDGYREAYGTAEEVKDRDIVQDGDIVNIDYVGRCSCGIKFEGGSAEGFDLTIGSGSFIDGFESGLIGAKKGSTVKIKVTFPKEYQDADIAGKEVEFTVTINKISALVLAEYNDALVSKITNKAITTVADFNKYIETELKISKKGAVLEKFQKELVKKTTFTEKTNALVEENYKEALKYYEDYAEMYKYTFDQFATALGFESADDLRKVIKEDAEAEVQNELVLYAYGNAIGFTLSNETALALLDELVLLQGSGTREDILKSFGVEMIRSEVYTEALADVIINNYK